MAYLLIIKPKARKNLEKIPEQYRVRIVTVLDLLITEPFSGKKLSGDKKGQYSIRIWPYRIIYRIDRKELIIIVINIDHRQGAYK